MIRLATLKWSKNAIDRFLAKAETSEENNCWFWCGSKDRNGYGQFKIQRKQIKAHRIAFFLYFKKDPYNGLVCHHCDNPSCINPTHLFEGTARDNMRDMVTKGRCKPPKLKGEKVGSARLTSQNVQLLRKLYTDGVPRKKIAQKFGISIGHVCNIAQRKKWKHVQ